MYTLSLIDALVATYKERAALHQEAAVARRLHVERTALANYRSGERRMPDVAIAELADGLHLPVEDVMAAVNISLKRATDEDRAYWVPRIKTPRIKQLAIEFGHWKEGVSKMRENQG